LDGCGLKSAEYQHRMNIRRQQPMTMVVDFIRNRYAADLNMPISNPQITAIG